MDEQALAAAVVEAAASGGRLRCGSGTRARWLPAALGATHLGLDGVTGIVDYEPTELVVTARAGTTVRELGSVLGEAGQMLPFDPPAPSAESTIGGCVASGMSGPRRPFAGAARDFVLGARMINGRGEILAFGGRVMKNVAGYDVSRLLAGSRGRLGILLEISFKVLPQPEQTLTRRLEMDLAAAIEAFSDLRGQFLPLAGAVWRDGSVYLRLAGSAAAVGAAADIVGGDTDSGFDWSALANRSLDELQGPALVRCAVPPAAAPMDTATPVLVDWAGAVRWFAASGAEASAIAAWSRRVGGQSTVYGPEAAVAVPAAPLEERIFAAFDPDGVFALDAA